ncbi:MAG TPA: YkgJ family cysteine cluster protein [Ramlibacter sp.]|uniref:YkgJ family cysteine cluster protein n=1 Tax=Ramlibacter sp. TaxID=1917967 RepID=UPI002ED49ABE
MAGESLPEDALALVERQAERWADPRTQQRAQEQVRLAAQRARASEPRVGGLLKQLEKAPRIQHRIFWLRQLAEVFGESVGPHSACSAGCDACCRQPVVLTQQEAEVIARETGAPLHQPATWSAKGDERYVAQPCSFLEDSRCTIYEHRPMVCRLMFSMDVDDLLCHRVPGALSHMPYADYSQHKELYLRAHLGKVKSEEALQAGLQQLKLADIREFFPQGAGRR